MFAFAWWSFVFSGSILAPAIAQTSTLASSDGQSILAEFKAGINPASSIPPGLPRSDNPLEDTRGVIRGDDRVPVTSRSYPWSAIGRVEFQDENGDGYICTGTLVKPDIVLTNAHCVVNPDTGRLFQNIRFAPNLIDGRLKDEGGRANAIDLLAGTDFRDRNEPPHPDDWAFLQLDKPLGEKYGTIGWQALPLPMLIENPEQFIMVGYSGDFPASNPGATAGAHEGCSILGSVNDDVLRHNCDTEGGSSGGPILAVIDGEYTIVAVNSSGRVNTASGAGIVNFATKISRIVEQLQAKAR
ncbi:trypsin-like serine peptidase [Leptolyngbya ohadii]|uniref:trypsin-like serine peptidase n=1 Tax=Leptolyngbya ohadii TaxID=1962290 RepID=UPI0015C616F9|nr:trypsin-like peptidase domain-containing protein [Leptolyngbya ohadii]